MEYLGIELRHIILTKPNFWADEKETFVCLYIDKGKNVIGVSRENIYRKLGLVTDNNLYDTFNIDIPPYKTTGNHILFDNEEEKEKLRETLIQFGQNIYDFQEKFIAAYWMENKCTLNAIKKLDKPNTQITAGNFLTSVMPLFIEEDSDMNCYNIYDGQGTVLIQFNNENSAKQFSLILRGVVSVIIDYYKNL